MNDILFTVSAAVIGMIAFVLVFEHHYEDGVVGRAALGIVAVMAIVVVFSVINGGRYEMPPEVAWLTLGLAIFMARHYYRFLCYTRFGRYIWTGDQKSDALKERSCAKTQGEAPS